MSDSPALAPVPLDDSNPGVAALSRLTERIATLVPPASTHAFARPQPSPAVRAGLARASAMSAKAARRAARPPRSAIGMAIDGFVSACSFVPYALVALGLRILMARIFFLDGQTRIEGSRLLLNVYDYHFAVTLPMQVKAATFTAFLTQYAPLPVPPVFAAYLVSYAEFILPIMLVIGFGARIATFGMLIMTAVISFNIMPEALLSVHIFWFAVLAVLLSQGPGELSIDYVIRHLTRRA